MISQDTTLHHGFHHKHDILLIKSSPGDENATMFKV